jgi:hypothetical protein
VCRNLGRCLHTLRARYSVCTDWLAKVGLAIEPEKTELMFFQKPYEHNPMPAPSRIILPDRDINSYFTVSPVENLRYLGFFINRRLNWEHHVCTMCNQARASIKALMVLGNSIRGLSMANWRLVLNAVCLPVMTWGCQLWFKKEAPKVLVKMLQQVQNEDGQSGRRSFSHGSTRTSCSKSLECSRCVTS